MSVAAEQKKPRMSSEYEDVEQRWGYEGMENFVASCENFVGKWAEPVHHVIFKLPEIFHNVLDIMAPHSCDERKQSWQQQPFLAIIHY